MQVTGQKSAAVRTVPPKWTYGAALAQVEGVPTLQLSPTDTSLNQTSLAAPSVYEAQYNMLYSTHREGTVANTYGFAHSIVPSCSLAQLTVAGSQ